MACVLPLDDQPLWATAASRACTLQASRILPAREGRRHALAHSAPVDIALPSQHVAAAKQLLDRCW